jgi:hypothetical protein
MLIVLNFDIFQESKSVKSIYKIDGSIWYEDTVISPKHTHGYIHTYIRAYIRTYTHVVVLQCG